MPILSAQDISFAYPHGSPLLERLSLSFAPGSLTVLMGANGSGKSTLLKLLSGLLTPLSGSLLLDHQPLSSLSPQIRARKIGLLLQTPPPPFEISVRDFVQIGRTPRLPRLSMPAKIDEEAVSHVLEQMNLTNLANHFITELSGGEYQRTRLAALLALESDILLLDEPANSLDPSYTKLLGETLQNLCAQGKTVIVISHQLDWTETYGQRLLLLHQGKILCDGSPKELLTPENLRLLF